MGKAFRLLGVFAACAVLTFIGLSWTWAGLSIVTHNLAGSCEKIEFQPLGVGVPPRAGSCLAKGDASSWGLPGGLVGTLIILGGAVLILIAVDVVTGRGVPGLGRHGRSGGVRS